MPLFQKEISRPKGGGKGLNSLSQQSAKSYGCLYNTSELISVSLFGSGRQPAQWKEHGLRSQENLIHIPALALTS